MATVTLVDMWIHNANDLTTYVKIPLNRLGGIQSKVEGEVRRYAGGRLRQVRRPGEQDRLNINLVMVPQADVDTLNDWTGREVLFRDPKGRIFYGVYQGLQVSEQAGPVEYVRGVSFTFEETSRTAEV